MCLCYKLVPYFMHLQYHFQTGVRDKTNIIYKTSLATIFGVKKYANSLMKVVEKK